MINRKIIYAMMSVIIASCSVSGQNLSKSTADKYTKAGEFIKDYRISDARNIFMDQGFFYDAGGEKGTAGKNYNITTLHAKSGCLKIYFEEFDIPAGAKLKIYDGATNTKSALFGTYSRGDVVWDINLVASAITIEYFPSQKNSVDEPGWKAKVMEVACAGKGPQATYPESDCPYAIPLCSNSTVVTVGQYVNFGNINDDQGTCFVSAFYGSASVWYSFYPQANGPLDFTIAPTGGADYDFVVYDITNGCANKQQISCNYSEFSGPTGLSDANCNDSQITSPGNCSNNGCNTDYKTDDCNRWNRRLNVLTTHHYVLEVTFYAGSNYGFVLTFANEPGSVAVTDNIPPAIANVGPNSCTNASVVHLDFSEYILCSSIGNDPNEFTIPGYTVTVLNTNCVNGNTLGIDLTISPPLAPGSYNLTVTNITDICGNVMNQTIPITIGAPVAEAGPHQVICQSRTLTLGGTYNYTYNPGSVNLTATGGSTYAWSNGGNTQTISVTPTTTTAYTVTASVGTCTSTDSTLVIVEGANAGNDMTICSGQSVTLTASPSVTYQWYTNPNILFGTNGTAVSPGGTNQSITVAPTANTTYRVIVTTLHGCTSTWDLRIVVSTTAPLPLSASNTLCFGSSGTATLTATGYDTYSWAPGGMSGNSVSVSPPATTTYTVNASTLTGCSGTNTITVFVNANPTAIANINPGSVCQGGTVNLSATAPGSVTLFSENFETGNQLMLRNSTGCTAGSGNVNAWARGTAAQCTGNYSLYISNDGGITNAYSTCAVVSHAYFDVNIPSCYSTVNFTFNYKVNGKAAHYLAVWNTPAQYYPAPNTLIDAAGSGGVQLGGNTYDVMTCTAASYNLSAFSGQTRRIIFEWRNTNASVDPPPALIDDILVTGTPSYTYTWASAPAGFSSTLQNPTDNPSANTAYYVTVTRCDGCSTTDTTNVTISPITVTATASNPTICPGDSSILTAGGATSYTWNPGGLTGSSITVYPTGNVTYTVTGSNGSCSDTQTVSVAVSASANATITSTGPYCEGLAPFNLSAATTGGTWSGTGITDPVNGTFNPGSAGLGQHQIIYTIAGACGSADTSSIDVVADYNATITPAGPFCSSSAPYNLTAANTGGTWSGTGVNPATGVFSPSVAGVGTFNIVYTISGACGDDDTIALTVNQAQNATINPVGPYCTNASSVNLTAASSGGVWSGTGITNSSLGTFNPSVAGAGTFTITYGIAGACGDTATTTITVNQLANATITAAGPFCSDDVPYTLIAANTGGTWSGTGVNAATGIFSPSLSGAGTFNIIYTISGACGDDDTLSIQVNPAANATINAAGPYCVSDTTATLSAAQSGGSWSGTGITNTTNGTFNPSQAGVGTHQIIYAITGACGDADTITVNVVTQANATINPAGPFCANIPATNLTAITSGGSWSGTGITNITNGTFDPGTAGQGNHTITYTIGGLCGDVDTAIIKVVAAPMLAVNGIAVSCEGATDGSASATAGGGTPPYVFHWDNNANTQNISDLAPGSYLVVVTDDNGCQDARTVTIDGSAEPCEIIVPVLYVPNIFTPNGDGENDILYVRGKGVESLEFAIYDRWGEKIFESAYTPQGDDRVSIGWDGTFHGKPVISDVYVWYLKAVMIDDKSYNWKGSLTLTR